MNFLEGLPGAYLGPELHRNHFCGGDLGGGWVVVRMEVGAVHAPCLGGEWAELPFTPAPRTPPLREPLAPPALG